MKETNDVSQMPDSVQLSAWEREVAAEAKPIRI